MTLKQDIEKFRRTWKPRLERFELWRNKMRKKMDGNEDYFFGSSGSPSATTGRKNIIVHDEAMIVLDEATGKKYRLVRDD